jgi:hypothetical protein
MNEKQCHHFGVVTCRIEGEEGGREGRKLYKKVSDM